MHADLSISDIYDSIQKNFLNHILSPQTEKIIRNDPSLLLGESHLFHYDSTHHALVLTPPFQNLLIQLVKLGELDYKALKANNLYELNSILQRSQGFGGGLLRKEGTERWHLEDNPIHQKYSQTLHALLQQLGFVSPKSIDHEMSIDHCILFGACTKYMETRIIETWAYLNNNLKVTEHIFLLGSNRKLIPAEIVHLKCKLETVTESQRFYWSDIFNDPEKSTEANAFLFLWRCIVPQEMQALLENKLVCIQSTRIGSSYHEQFGHRVTTEITIEDWIRFYRSEKPQAIFAIAEQPYIRLADQLKFTVLSQGKKANQDELIERMRNTSFYFAFPNPLPNPSISVILDEIGRHLYRALETLNYLEAL